MPKNSVFLTLFLSLLFCSPAAALVKKLPVIHTPENTRLLFDVDEVLLEFPQGKIKRFVWQHKWALLKNITSIRAIWGLNKQGAPGSKYAQLFAKDSPDLASAIDALNKSKILMPGMQQLLTKLKERGVQLDIGTNKPVDDLAFYQEKFPEFFGLFTNVKAIKENGTHKPCQKPDPNYFREYLKEFPSTKHTVFFDDKASNTEGARKAGLKAFQFTSVEQVSRDLQALFRMKLTPEAKPVPAFFSI